jgi:ribonuclease BN (tRNA processing enzyme)
VDLVVVGCSGSFPGPDSPASCYLLEHEGSRILLDMGNGSLGSLARYADIYDIDAVLVSHLHVDHFIDLCSYYVALRYRPGGNTRPVAVWGPSDTGRRLVAAYGMRGDENVTEEFEIRDLDPQFSIGPFAIRTSRVVHPVEAYGVRVEAGGRVLAFSGDTGPTDRLVDLARGADVALFEASFLEAPDNPTDLHLTARQAADHAARAGAERLVLTHLVPWNDRELTREQADGHFPGDLMLAEPGLRITV